MNTLFKHTLFAFVFSGLQLISFAQSAQKNGTDEESLIGWHLRDLNNDKFYGISLDQAYTFLREKKLKSKTVIVAVIDSGIDTLHEDLKPILWKTQRKYPATEMTMIKTDTSMISTDGISLAGKMAPMLMKIHTRLPVCITA